ncbi:hypothetical protein F6X40_10650 [Paraburkholderia sp. UCT31]|uniref:hypothetical protein n=1 Tax=Paraburkholderia sp. UCT31 TaxID=2615209 RepID=UPI001655F899|nr:hypothetical protein [Paraburkholderia sp. UCT31]MBC8737267.1 hypothetical protein [Paraburkholderia sp. UCT31]
MNRSDVSKSTLLYFIGILAVGASEWGIRRCPVSLNVPHAKEVTLILFAMAAVFGATAFYWHVRRTSKPWSISSASVNISYALFFIAAVAGVAVSHAPF